MSGIESEMHAMLFRAEESLVDRVLRFFYVGIPKLVIEPMLKRRAVLIWDLQPGKHFADVRPMVAIMPQ